jgi:CRISPR/Cas system-associated protein Cas7 (RAMP superfamily)
MKYKSLTNEDVASFHLDGYVIVRNFSSQEEVQKMYSTALQDNAMKSNALDLNDQSGKKTKLSLWFTPGNDVFGYLTRSRRMLESISKLLDSQAPVCHYHSKLMQKEPRVGGA